MAPIPASSGEQRFEKEKKEQQKKMSYPHTDPVSSPQKGIMTSSTRKDIPVLAWAFHLVAVVPVFELSSFRDRTRALLSVATTLAFHASRCPTR